MIIVSDSGPIISFARAGHLELLRVVLHEIRIPAGVYDDIVFRGMGKPGAIEVRNAAWIKKEEIKGRTEAGRLPLILGLGEREAIILAQELSAILLIDDRRARREAEKREVVCFGSLRVLKEAKARKVIKEIKPIGDELRRKGIRIDDSLYQRFLREAGE